MAKRQLEIGTRVVDVDGKRFALSPRDIEFFKKAIVAFEKGVQV